MTNADSLPYAGRIVRLAAWIIDVIIVIAIIVILAVAGVGGNALDPDAEATVAESLVSAAVGFGYFFLLTMAFGATLGKMLLGLRVVDASGNKAGAGSIFTRELIARALGSLVAAVLGSNIGNAVGFVIFLVIAIMILFNAKRQGLHDKAAGTYVVRGR